MICEEVWLPLPWSSKGISAALGQIPFVQNKTEKGQITFAGVDYTQQLSFDSGVDDGRRF